MDNTPTFSNFDLHIGQGKDGVYPISVHYSPAGETTDPVQIPIACDDEPMRRWLQRLQDGRTKRDDLLALGRRLAGYLLPPGQVRDLYQRSLGMTDASRSNLRLRLRISPPELAALPWEYAYDEDIADFFVLNPGTALVRYHGQPVPPYSIASRAPVSILVLVSNPPDTAPLETVKETRNLIKALNHLLDENQIRIDVLFSGLAKERRAIEALVTDRAETRLLAGPASIDAVRDALRQGYRVVHYIGHGQFAQRIGGVLLLTDEEGNGTFVSAQTLARELRGSTAAVVVLNACKSAAESTARSFMGLAPNLIRAGVPAVVAMQYAIADSSALHFARALYKALADGWPLDAAVNEGRKAISVHLTEADMDWGIPVLFMRSPDGVIWQKEKRMDEKTATPTGHSNERGTGGVTFHGTATVHGDVVARDKIVHGDKVRGDKIEGHVGNVGPGAQVAIGKGISQTAVQVPIQLAATEREEIGRLLAELGNQLARLEVPENKKVVGQEFVGQLEKELTKTDEPPDASLVKVAGNWLLENVPALAGTLAGIFLNPVVGKVVEAAGDIATEWVRERFGAQA